jgi:hypothetical protein
MFLKTFRLIALKLSPSTGKLLEVRETPRSAMFSTRHERLISVLVSRLVIDGTAITACVLDHFWEVEGGSEHLASQRCKVPKDKET